MDLGRNLENYLNNYKLSWPLGGTILAARDGDILFKKAYGYASIEHQVPNTVESKYRIWSLTKSFTAMAVMILYEQGLLRFDDSISMYLPEVEHLNPITVYQLLNHTSGLTNYTSLPEYNRRLNKLRLSPHFSHHAE
ncbi:serine hydrolase [Paenibacillus chibensis]|uniref:Serine hydrolase n=1 Tax=Paenibacillus chibensis TaxID=59846 RepID=A0ABU6PWS0_9BACL|nr:serine hydrolase [Paenibacillus chibensis]